MKRLALVTSAALLALLLAAGAAVAAYQFQTTWGTAGAGAGQLNNPGLIAVGPDGSVYIADTGNQRLQKFTSDGAFLATIGSFGAGQGQFNSPNSVAVGPDGTVYVADSGNHRVQRFDANGGFLSTWGSLGAGAGQFGGMGGIAAAPDGSVFVADIDNKRVEKFLADGTYLQDITSGAGGFGTISGVAVGQDGSLYVVDQQGNRVERFDLNGLFQNAWGSQGAGDGQFNAPRGVAASAAGVYVADSSNNRVEKFTTAGAFVDSLDAAGSGDPAFSGPVGIAISPTGSIYVAQPGAARVSSFNETGGANLPPPSTGQTANAEPVNGTVKVRAPGSNQFVTLAAGQQIPIGSIVDVTKGTVDLTTTADATTTQTARFYSGVFKLAQTKTAKPVTELQLFGGKFNKCPKPIGRGARAAKKKKVVRQLWGSGKGRFRTKGKFASATIRGTQWLTQDFCDGTSVRVVEGSVTVRNIPKNKNVVVKAPQSVFIPARKR